MDFLTDADFRKQIKSSPATCYLFFGDEDYMKQHALETARKELSPDPTLAPFNEMRLDALSYSPAALLDMLMPLPMMADRKIITVTGLDFGAMKASDTDALCSVLSQLSEYDYNTVIISAPQDRFDYGNMPKRPSALLAKLSEYATPVYFERNTPSKLATWVGKHYAHKGVSASSDVCAFTVDYCGRDMFNLASETDKIAFWVLSQNRSEVTREDIIKVGTNAAEYDAFALTNAITAGKRDLALSILSDMKFKKTDPIIIMSEVTKTVCDMAAVSSLLREGKTPKEIASSLKLHEYRVSLLAKSKISRETSVRLIEKCQSADLALKSSGAGYDAIEKLICTM